MLDCLGGERISISISEPQNLKIAKCKCKRAQGLGGLGVLIEIGDFRFPAYDSMAPSSGELEANGGAASA